MPVTTYLRAALAATLALGLGATACSGGGHMTGTGGGAGPGSGGAAPTGSGGSATGSGGSGGGGTTGGGTGGAFACTDLPAIPQRLWRISAQQYSNATRDLLSLTTNPTVATSTDGVSAYALFSDVALSVSDSFLFSGFYQTAENILLQITPRLSQIARCETQETQTACATRFATQFGQKVFRRPLDPDEVTNLMKVYTQGATTDFNTGISLMIEALILSPSFLYRTELGPAGLAEGQPATLTSYEVATQLGFMFLNSTPDVTLMKAAAKQDNLELETPQGIMTQVTRLLNEPATKTNLTNVIANWFSLAQLSDKTSKDMALFTTLGTTERDQTAIVSELMLSAQAFITDTLWSNGGRVNDLLTSQKVFANKRLATLYGLPFSGVATTYQGLTWPAEQNRIGILSQPAFLWAVSAPSENSIVKRGQFLHDDIVCQDPLPPPIDLNSPLALSIIAMGDSEITKSDARMSPGVVCAGCHAQMDPYSRVLHNFGPIGNYRAADEAGRAINPSVTFSGSSPLAPQMIAGPKEFAQALVDSRVFTNCAIQRMTSYAVGSMVRKYNSCELNEIRRAFNASDGSLQSLFTQIALADFFRTRTGGAQ